jgi:hypothetical protein
VALIVLPLGAVPLLGYAIACTRTADGDGPPRWRISSRLLGDGLVVLGAIALIAVPFVLLGIPLAGALRDPALWHSNSTLLEAEAAISAALILALPWGIVMLLLMPHAVARFAGSGSARDLYDFAASVRSVRRDFAAWNLAVAAIVTGWAIGVACVALFCVGLAPGIFYAILVSAHATASLHPEGSGPSPR